MEIEHVSCDLALDGGQPPQKWIAVDHLGPGEPGQSSRSFESANSALPSGKVNLLSIERTSDAYQPVSGRTWV